MNIKKILAIIVILGLVLGTFIFALPSPQRNIVENTNTEEDAPSATSVDYNFEEEVAPEDLSVLSESTGDLNADGKQDRGVVLAVTGGGTGVFIYAALSVSGPVGYKGSNTVFIGDRVKPQSVSIQGGVMTVSYLDREDDEPFAAEPTIPKTKKFVYADGELKESN